MIIVLYMLRSGLLTNRFGMGIFMAASLIFITNIYILGLLGQSPSLSFTDSITTSFWLLCSSPFYIILFHIKSMKSSV